MQLSRAGWEERELAQVLPKIPTLCWFCHEVIATSHRRSAEDVTDRQEEVATESPRRTTRHKRRRRCCPRLPRPSSDIRFSESEKSAILRESTSKLTKNVRKSGENLSSSSSSASSLSLYTSDSSDDELDTDDRLSTSLTSPTSPCSFPFDQPTEVVSLPPDYLSKYSSLQDWLAERKSLRNAMGSKGDFMRWLQNKKQRTPLEERVLARSKPNYQENYVQMSGIHAVKCGAVEAKHSSAFSRSRSGATERDQLTSVNRALFVAADVGRDPPEMLESSDHSTSHEVPAGHLVSILDHHTTSVAIDAANLSENQNLSQKAPKSSGHLMSCESPTSELVSVLDDYLKQRRIRLLDLFRCVDVSRSGSCSRQDFRYLLKQAKVPLTQAQVEQLADSLSVADHPDCVGYSQLAVAMNRHSEMEMFEKRRADPRVDWQSSFTLDVSQFSSSSLVKDNGNDAAQAVPPVCPEVRRNEKAPCEDQKRSYCQRVLKLFRDNALFGEVASGKASPSSAQDDVVRELKSTMDADKGLATRLEEVRLRDRIEYEATRDAVRRRRLPVKGRALRRGLLAVADRPHSVIDARRLPSAHMLAAHSEKRRSEERIRTHTDSDDSLDKEVEGDPCRSAVGTGDASASSSWFGLRVKSASSSRHLHSASSSYRSAYDKRSQQGSMLRIGGSGEMSQEDDEEEEGEDGEGGKWGKDGAGDRRSTRASGRPSRPRTHQEVLELKRMQWELEEEKARKNAIYWPGRVDHVRVYHAEGERGGHPIFERVGQTWYNDDPRYLIDRCDDEVVNRYQCRSSSEQQQPRWAWRRTVEYGAAGPSVVYRCVSVNDSANH